jgi:hypothetical protein
MKKFSGAEYRMDTATVVEETLRSWIPVHTGDKRKRIATEKEWERALIPHLNESLDGVVVIAQGGAGKDRTDIMLQQSRLLGLGTKNDFIEIKKGLKKASEFQRLIGQITAGIQNGGWTFVLICGEEVDPKLLATLKQMYPTGLFSNQDHRKLKIFWKQSQTRGLTVVR